MPIYEFQCQDCQNRTSVFVRSVSSSVDVVCPSCGSKKLARLISRFGVSKTTKDVHAHSGSPADPDYYKDPRNIGRSVEERFAQMGMEIPSEIQDTIAAARDGVMPGSVKDLQPNVTEL